VEKEGPGFSEKRVPLWISGLITLFKNYREKLAEGESVLFFSEMEIDDSCTGCEVCASFCPTGALRGKSTQERFHLEWTPSHCSGCNLCKEVCPEHAIHFSSGLPVSKICEETSTIVKSHYEYHCPECRREYRSQDSKTPCPYCQKQADLMQDYARVLYGETKETSFKNE
jgi:Pyruvate/2-oxoacid:ferredoxin oxidoreductase delta subunit